RDNASSRLTPAAPEPMIPISMPRASPSAAAHPIPRSRGCPRLIGGGRLPGMVGSTARTGVTRAMATAPDALSLFAETSTALRRRVPFDAALWQTTDPATGLATAPMRAENLGSDACTAYWDTELLTERVNRFRDLARAPVPVAALRATTGDAPERSATYRRFLRPRGVDDELRAVLRVDGQWWGQVSLYRERGRAAFDRRDLGLV